MDYIILWHRLTCPSGQLGHVTLLRWLLFSHSFFGSLLFWAFLPIYYITKNISPKYYNFKTITPKCYVRTTGRIKNYFLSKSMQKKKSKLIMLAGSRQWPCRDPADQFFFFFLDHGLRHCPCRDPTKQFFFLA